MPPTKSTRLAPDARREQLVQLGLELLGATPYDQVSIESIARAAGISKGLLYHYFPTKADFVVAVLRHSYDELSRRMAEADGLDGALDAFLGYVEERATGFFAVLHARAGGEPAIRAVLEAHRAARVDRIVDVAAALTGTSREEIASPTLTLAIEGWLFFCDGVVGGWLERGEPSRADVLRLLRENLLASVAAATRAPVV
ncbi:MAG TPA: TetR/AcrR family transcriptional regulator [Baekduia sp.]|uniref:TetR/AcrR family transcriptional regulator n=1 Tax=Baekduia sp. TaxID=2600305 RepID=UPI002D76BE24|nr:TetR/AcrR family transcriptional regulator [Baekduia sp.]HET6507273.1 TetR/AcrR family transcriptional regulator [Baekduia sp.]